MRQQVGRTAQVPLHHDAPVGGREQGLPVADHDRVVVHVQDASLGVDLDRDLVHRTLSGQPDADIEELVDAGFAGQTRLRYRSGKGQRVKPASGEDDSKTEQAKPARAKGTASRLRYNTGLRRNPGMTKRAAPYEAAPDPHAQLTLRRPDLSQQRPPRASGHRQHRARPVSGIPHHDPGPGSPDLYALPSVATAVSALAPVGAVPFHRSAAFKGEVS